MWYRHLSEAARVALSLLLLAGVFIADFFTQLGFAHGILYLPSILILAARSHEKAGQWIVCLCVTATFGGLLIAPAPPDDFPFIYVLINRAMSAVVLVLTFLLIKQRQKVQASADILNREVQDRKAYFEVLVEQLPIQIWSADPAGNVDFVGDELAEFVGRSREEIIADWLSVLHPDDKERSLEEWMHSVETGIAYDVDFRIRRFDGHFIWHKTKAKKTGNGPDSQGRWLGSTLDVDELYRKREEAQHLARTMQNTLESISDGFLTLDADLRCKFVNSKAAIILNSEQQDLLGRQIWNIDAISKDTRLRQSLEKAALEQCDLEFEYFLESGDRWLDVRAYATDSGLTLYLRDVSRQKRDRAELSLLSNAVARLNDVVLITEANPFDEPGPRIVYVNDAFIRRTGYSRDEVLGRNPRFLQGPLTPRSELDRIRNALENEEPVRAQLVNYRKSGEPYWIELDISPVADQDGRCTHLISVQRDVSERKKLEEQLAVAQRMESIARLSGGVAHDFNNLLGVIIGNAESIKEDCNERPETIALTDLILRAADKGAALTQNLLAFSKHQELRLSKVNVPELIESAYPILKATVGEKNRITLDFKQNEKFQTLVDAGQLENCLINLALNARDAMPGGGNIVIRLQAVEIRGNVDESEAQLGSGEYVEITFSDTGTGMSKEVAGRIFEPFFSTKSVDGTGLGLSIVYGFVKQSGGNIYVYSEENMGTVFKLYLPLSPLEDQGTASLAKEGPSELPKFRERSVLIVEDNPEIRNLASRTMESLGLKVVAADTAEAAKSMLAGGFRPALVFTDVVMPGEMSGIDLALYVNSTMPDIAVLLTSGFADVDAFPQLAQELNLPMLNKPYRRAELVQMTIDSLGETQE